MMVLNLSVLVRCGGPKEYSEYAKQCERRGKPTGLIPVNIEAI